MAKLLWCFPSETEALWSKTLQAKYIRGNPKLVNLKRKARSSNAWQGIIAATHLLQKGMKSRVYNGRDTLFGQDKWLEDIPLINLATKEVSVEDSVKTVEAYWHNISG